MHSSPAMIPTTASAGSNSNLMSAKISFTGVGLAEVVTGGVGVGSMGLSS